MMFWVELRDEQPDRVVAGVAALAAVPNLTVIVSATAGDRALLREVRRRTINQPIEIVPAMKAPRGHFENATSLMAWIRAAVVEWRHAFGSLPRALALDLEPALAEFHRGEVIYSPDDVLNVWAPFIAAAPLPLWTYMPQIVPGKPQTDWLAAAWVKECLRKGDRILPGWLRGPGRPPLDTINGPEELEMQSWAIKSGVKMHEQVVVTLAGNDGRRRCFTPRELVADWKRLRNEFPLLAQQRWESLVINTSNADWPQIAMDFAKLLTTETAMGIANATLLPREFAFEREGLHITTAGFLTTGGTPLPPNTFPPPVLAAQLRDPYIPTGAAGRRLLGRDNGRVVADEHGRRWLEVAVQFYNTDAAGVPIVQPIHALQLIAPIRREDYYNPLRGVEKPEIRAMHVDPYIPEMGDDERRIVGDLEIPPTSMIPQGSGEWTNVLFPIPETTPAVERMAVGLAVYR